MKDWIESRERVKEREREWGGDEEREIERHGERERERDRKNKADKSTIGAEPWMLTYLNLES